MKSTRDKSDKSDKSKHASHAKSTSHGKHSSASKDASKERSSHASHGKSSERAGAKSNERGAHGGSGTREHAKHSPIGIQKALKGASYPARKEDLLETAQANGADDSTLQTLRDMPDDEYDTPAAVSKAIGHEM
ncbi:DUF2795 domain-containing protein [Ralstonia mannitolilytica]|uniref:DUF2795 domain-containing protein n=1 Tax=Ralstonia mannitolilytica TaxID=105219 RepID=A0AAD2AR17_9RALS|nr:DUF2795 domain-containing protein [Ralstonia mannitolilytica]MBY4718106.1 DUF2795 domain-containing protein [Ralstonia mannitolilytica]CAJ0682807.1 hypothetical protein R77591_02033 [Ralstonia mannitolilytica]CAJ0860293.1 hypothetical protein R77569_01328 [Ralstonia mannitolilytica]